MTKALVFLLVIIALVAGFGLASASEITGTLSNDPSQITVNNPPPEQTAAVSQASAWELPVMVKALMVVFLILEIVVLLVLHSAKKRKRLAASQNWGNPQ